jgi:hypothetical protein
VTISAMDPPMPSCCVVTLARWWRGARLVRDLDACARRHRWNPFAGLGTCRRRAALAGA